MFCTNGCLGWAVSRPPHLSQYYCQASLFALPLFPLTLLSPHLPALPPQDQIICGEGSGKGHLVLLFQVPFPSPLSSLTAVPFVRQIIFSKPWAKVFSCCSCFFFFFLVLFLGAVNLVGLNSKTCFFSGDQELKFLISSFILPAVAFNSGL